MIWPPPDLGRAPVGRQPGIAHVLDPVAGIDVETPGLDLGQGREMSVSRQYQIDVGESAQLLARPGLDAVGVRLRPGALAAGLSGDDARNSGPP